VKRKLSPRNADDAGSAGAILAEQWLWALLATFAAATIAILVGPAPSVASWITQTVVDAVFVGLSWRLTLRTPSPDARRFWRAVTVSGLLFTASALVRAVDAIASPELESTLWTVPSALLTIGSAWLLIFMLIRIPNRAGPQRAGPWFDAATVMVAAAVFIWTIAVTGGMDAEQPEQVAWTVVGAVIMLVSAFAITRLLVSGVAPFTVASGVALGLATTLHGLERALNPQVMGADDSSVALVIRLLPPLLLAAAVCLARLGRSAVARSDDRGLGGRMLAPLVAVVATQLLLIAQLSDEGLTVRSWGTALGTLILAVLIIVRQDIIMVENARLVGKLDRTLDTLSQQEQRFRSLVEHASDITLVLGADGVVTYGTPALRRVLGQDPTAAAGRRAEEVLRPVDARQLDTLLEPLLRGGTRSGSGELDVYRADGAKAWLQVVATERLEDPSVAGVVVNIRDITESVALRERLRYDASHDQLTGLANRALFNERAEALRAPDVRNRGNAVLLLDLDQFKDVNDRLGHQAGDQLLKVVATRLRHSVRPTDTVARLGGDEFTIILPDTAEADALAAAWRIVDALAQPVSIEGQTLRPAASVGVAFSIDKPLETLLRDADEAMYEAKRRRSGAQLFGRPDQEGR